MYTEEWIVRISAWTQEEIIAAVHEKYSYTNWPIVIEDGGRVLCGDQVIGRIRNTGASWVYEEVEPEEEIPF